MSADFTNSDLEEVVSEVR